MRFGVGGRPGNGRHTVAVCLMRAGEVEMTGRRKHSQREPKVAPCKEEPRDVRLEDVCLKESPLAEEGFLKELPLEKEARLKEG